MSFTKAAAAWWGSGALVVVAGVGTTYLLTSGTAPVAPSSATSNPGSATASGGSASYPITLTGAVDGKLAPGTPASLNVTITNTNPEDIVVTEVTAQISTVTSAGIAAKPACSADWFTMGTFSGSKLVTKNSSGVVALPVTLSDLTETDQDNCKGATYSFTFTALAQQA